MYPAGPAPPARRPPPGSRWPATSSSGNRTDAFALKPFCCLDVGADNDVGVTVAIHSRRPPTPRQRRTRRLSGSSSAGLALLRATQSRALPRPYRVATTSGYAAAAAGVRQTVSGIMRSEISFMWLRIRKVSIDAHQGHTDRPLARVGGSRPSLTPGLALHRDVLRAGRRGTTGPRLPATLVFMPPKV